MAKLLVLLMGLFSFSAHANFLDTSLALKTALQSPELARRFETKEHQSFDRVVLRNPNEPAAQFTFHNDKCHVWVLLENRGDEEPAWNVTYVGPWICIQGGRSGRPVR